MDPNSFKGKIILSIVDKIIIGSVAALIVLLFNAKYSEYQKIREQSVAVSKIYTDILMQHRGELLRSMQNYFSVLNEIRYNEKVEAAHLIQLSKIKNEMDLTVTNLNTIDSQIKKSAEPLLAAIDHLNNSLRNLYRPGEINFEPSMNVISKGEGEIRALYEKFLQDFRDIAIKTVKRDLEAI